ncbi:hypothetical protein L1987_38047 [Smallanthus sonchifolius]|uniref:Uncharacterized protein n=1 Tax=Smallanthus sonchifolius TaxID=185202 RepID=A0ACB9HJV7_9ASTR|nr:hypothetical protein L1987_38047 [Smallanthus sonchifolius]
MLTWQFKYIQTQASSNPFKLCSESIIGGMVHPARSSAFTTNSTKVNSFWGLHNWKLQVDVTRKSVGDDIFQSKIANDVEQGRRLSNLSDWAQSVSSLVDLQVEVFHLENEANK